MFKLTKFTTDDDYQIHEGYSDGSTWNGWYNVALTRAQVAAWLDSSPYDYKFLEANSTLNNRDYPVLIIYMEDEDIIESSPVPTEEGIIEAYFMEGYCFMKLEDTFTHG